MQDNAAHISRRALLAAGAMTMEPALAQAQAQSQDGRAAIPLVDTHIHIFDPNRPQGAPYKGPAGSLSNTLGAFPDRYMSLMQPLGSVGAIIVEASGWVEDNFWVLEQCKDHPSMLGLIGNLAPDSAEFPAFFDRLRKNPLFLGLRYGNLFGYDLVSKSTDPKFKDGIRRMVDAGMALDTANPNVPLLEAVLRVSDGAPDLRIIIDHLPKIEPSSADQAGYQAALRELKSRPNVYTKLSAVIRPINGQTSTELAPYRGRLDELYETFGEDRVLFGSDWPNSDGVAPVDKVVAVVREYFAGKTRVQAEKYFWRNSIKAYRWKPRSPAQAALVA